MTPGQGPAAAVPAEGRGTWHALPAGRVLELAGSADGGLTGAEAAARLAAAGANETAPVREEGFWEELAESFREPLQLLLIVVAVLSAVFGELRDAAAIAVVIVAVALTETITEQRAGRAIGALRRLSAPTARIRRPAASPAGPAGAAGPPGPSRAGGEGTVVEVPAAQLVAGDVIVVEAGDLIPADARVLSGEGLRADESSLTGEAVPSAKGPAPVQDGADLAERSSMLYAGTAVAAGEGTAVVVATGGATELGRLGPWSRGNASLPPRCSRRWPAWPASSFSPRSPRACWFPWSGWPAARTSGTCCWPG